MALFFSDRRTSTCLPLAITYVPARYGTVRTTEVRTHEYLGTAVAAVALGAGAGAGVGMGMDGGIDLDRSNKVRRFRSPFRRPDSQSSEARTCGAVTGWRL